MPVTYTRHFYDNILLKIKAIIVGEFFEQGLHVYVDNEFREISGVSCRIYLNQINLEEELGHANVYEHRLEISYYLNYPNTSSESDKEALIEKLFNDTNRLQELLWQNRKTNQSGSNLFYDGKVEQIVVNSKKSDEANIDNLQVATLDYRCYSLINIEE